MTAYVVLERIPLSGESPGTGWTIRDQVEARSSRSAIRQYLNGGPDGQGGDFVAVPLQSWKPTTVKPETVTRLKFQ